MPTEPQRPGDDSVVAETTHLRLIQRGHWGFVQRRDVGGVVAVIATTADRQLVVVQQFRPPLNRDVLELPAGLAGDLPDQRDETFESAARRELLEETGFTSHQWRFLFEAASSAGLTDEVVAFFRAESVQRVAAGGGDDSEDIQVHCIAVDDLDAWLAEQSARGISIDGRVYLATHLLRNEPT